MLNVMHSANAHVLAVGNEGFLIVSGPHNAGNGRLRWSTTILDHHAFTLARKSYISAGALETAAFGRTNEQQGIQALADLASFLIAAADDNTASEAFTSEAIDWAQNNADQLDLLTSDLADEIAGW